MAPGSADEWNTESHSALQWVLEGSAVSYERGIPVIPNPVFL